MRKELIDNELEEVVGGTVNLSEKKNKIGFSTLGEGYTLKCSFKEARNLVATMFAANTDATEREFDTLVRDAFASRGWI